LRRTSRMRRSRESGISRTCWLIWANDSVAFTARPAGSVAIRALFGALQLDVPR
jgi:hypothetical protein